jgi:hypothetical protein
MNWFGASVFTLVCRSWLVDISLYSAEKGVFLLFLLLLFLFLFSLTTAEMSKTLPAS